MSSAGLRFGVLGPLEVIRAGSPVDLGSPKQQAVLALLLLQRGRVVSTDRLIDAVWASSPPASALASLQAYVSNLRRALRDEASAASPIVRRAQGYLLDVPAESVDLHTFLTAADGARAAASEGRWTSTLDLVERALALWRGPLLADMQDEPWVREESAPLDELRSECRETLVSALLGEGQVAPALAEAQRLHAEHPLRERACWLYVLSLYRAGRAPEALDALRAHVELLDRQLGLEPSAELRELQRAMLNQDPALAAWPRPPSWSGGSRLHTPASAISEQAVEAAQPAPDDAADAASALVGRAREREIIERSAAAARDGSASWLVLSGPAGIGKSRLAEEATRIVRAAGGSALWARCPEDGGAPAWWPIRELVRGLGADPDTVLMPPASVEIDQARFVVYDRVLNLLQHASAAHPQLVVVDDVQWADETSLRCLTFIASALREQAVLVVLTLRDGEADAAVEPLLAALARGASYHQIAVPALTPGEVQTLADRVSGERFGPAEARLLAERTEGNPLFVSEYARLPPEQRAGGDIPLAVRSVLGRRLDGLDPAVLQLLRAAAVIGDEIDLGLLAATTRLDLDTIADYLDEAADERIIVPVSGGSGYGFAHGLLREAILAATPALRRQRLHARAAEALASATDGDSLSRRAQHLLSALPIVEPAVVLAACRAAALGAADRWSSETEARWWEAALRAFDLLPADERRADERDDLLVARLEALARAGRGQTVLDVVDAGLLDAVREGRTSAIGRLAGALLRTAGGWPWLAYGNDPGPVLARLTNIEPYVVRDPRAHARVLAALAVGNCYAIDPAVAEGLSTRAVELAESLGDPNVIADALLGRVLTYAGISSHSHEAIELLDRLVALEHRHAEVDEAIRHSALAMTYLNLGELELADEHTRRGAAMSDLLRLPIIRVQTRWMDFTLALFRGDVATAERLYENAAEMHATTELYGSGSVDLAELCLAWERGQLGQMEFAKTLEPMPWLAAMAAAKGDRATAAARVAAFLAVERAPLWTTLGQVVVVAHVVADLGLAEHAPHVVELLEPHADRVANVGQIGVIGSVSLALARLSALLGDEARARELAEAAAAMAARTRSPSLALRARLVRTELGDEPRAGLADLAAGAAALGLHGVEAAARALGDRLDR